MGKPPKFTTLVFSPLSQRARSTGDHKPWVDKPWVGLHDGRRWVWRTNLAYHPGRINFFKPLIKHRRQLRLDAILVVTDPAPFTASRAAVSIANALGFAWDRPVVSISTQDLDRTSPSLLVERALTQRKGPAKYGFSLADRALPHYNRKPY
ncbi:MAG: hypothetical protein V1895_00970 [Parcubacteria group bacterium]